MLSIPPKLQPAKVGQVDMHTTHTYTAVSVPENVSGIKTKGNVVVSVVVASTSECVHGHSTHEKNQS